MSGRVANLMGVLIGAAALAWLLGMRYLPPAAGLTVTAIMSAGLVAFIWFAAGREQTSDAKPARTPVIVILLWAALTLAIARQAQGMMASEATAVQFVTVGVGYLACTGILSAIGWSRGASRR